MTGAARRGRGRYAAAAVAAGVLTLVFSTVGDGVDAPGATGPARLLVDAGHQTVWGLLAAAFMVAAVRDGWGRASQVLAVGGGLTYVAFLAAVFFG